MKKYLFIGIQYIINYMLCFANPLFLGLWLLRSTNDMNFKKGTTFLDIDDNYHIGLSTKFTDGIIGKTFKRTGYIVNTPINTVKNIDLFFTRKTLSSYSILGFEIPESAENVFTYERPKSLILEREVNTLIIKDKNSKLFYIFDLFVHERKGPQIETRWNNFLFIQFIGFILNIVLVQTFHVFVQNNSAPI